MMWPYERETIYIMRIPDPIFKRFDDNTIPTNARGQRSLAQGRLKDRIIKDSWKATQRRHGRR